MEDHAGLSLAWVVEVDHGNVFVNGDELIGVDMDETVHVFRLPPVGK